MCSICAISSSGNSRETLTDLVKLIFSGENRGNESIGAAAYNGKFVCAKRMGVNLDALGYDLLRSMGDAGISAGVGQTRYSTSGQSDIDHAQPFTIKGKSEFVINHNGTVANAQELVKKHGLPVKTHSDTEALGQLIAGYSDIETGIREASKDAIGGWNLSLLEPDGTIYVFRDPMGFSPLFYQQDEEGFTAASEDSALFAVGRFAPERVEPGELLVVREGRSERRRLVKPTLTECPFEPAYFMKTGSTYRDDLVHDIRRDIGWILGKREGLRGDDVVVMPILESGRYYAEGLADAADLEYAEGLMKNRGKRVYMHPDERAKIGGTWNRQDWAALKHVPLPPVVRGKRLIVTDDSIVRGDTTRVVTKNLRTAGAAEVHWRIGFPPVKWGCIYKMDHQKRSELIAARAQDAHAHTERYVTRFVGADSVHYPTWAEVRSVLESNEDFGRDNHCTACFTGKYPTRVPEEARRAIE
ncbi:MAG: hypothetical protein HYS81_04085 [Candidatus Aenigmatarchaeota archaeon]|nr:MAG: hypothetical protein HYS81_04085 [Candidatus Aenigmarchaeota archaeon]